MKLAHFSIDDVGASFRYMYNKRPASIFDLRLYSQLLKWHEQYGLIASLYCIFMLDGFDLFLLPDRYQYEFEKNANWLKFGFHSRCSIPFIKDADYKTSYVRTLNFIKKMKMGRAQAIRLHSWYASDEQELFLKENGVTTIFMPTDGIVYSDDGTYENNGIIHRRTDCWIEKMKDVSEASFGLDKEYLTLFTHEWCFDDQKERINTIIKVLFENGFTFE